MRLPGVVGIKKGKPKAARGGNSGVSGGRGAAIVRVCDDFHAGRSRGAKQCRRWPVGAGVVDNDDLEILKVWADKLSSARTIVVSR